MSKKLSDLPVATVLNPTDPLYTVQAGVSKSVPASLAGGSGDPNIIWQWDGTLNDFTNGAPPEVTGGAKNGALSLVTTSRGNAALRVTSDATAGIGQASWAINPAALSETLPTRFTIEYELEEAGDGAGGWAPGSGVGFSPFCQYNGAGDVLAYSVAGTGNANWFSQIWTRNTTISASGGTPTWRHAGATTRGLDVVIHVEHQLGVAFDMSLKCELKNTAHNVTIFRYADVAGLDFDGTRFNNETPNTIGMAAWFTAPDHFFDFTRITLLKHPADR